MSVDTTEREAVAGQFDEQQAPPSPEDQFGPQDRELLHEFYGFVRGATGIEARDAEPRQAIQLSYAAHDYLHQLAGRQIETMRQKNPQAFAERMPTTMSLDPVQNRIAEYYREFGTGRRSHSGIVLARENDRLAAHKKPFFAVKYAKASVNDQGELVLEGRMARYESFPEAKSGLILEHYLRILDHTTAADSVEVVVAAYGQWLQALVGGAGRLSLMEREEHDGYSHSIHRIGEDTIPDDLHAENPANYRPRRRDR